jgi:hypothetical protein
MHLVPYAVCARWRQSNGGAKAQAPARGTSRGLRSDVRSRGRHAASSDSTERRSGSRRSSHAQRVSSRSAPVAQWIERRPPKPDRLSVVATRVEPRAKRLEFLRSRTPARLRVR